MDQIVTYLIILFCLITFNICLWMMWNAYNFYKEKSQIKDFTDYIALLDYYMNKAYDIIYKDRILVYSLEATKIPDKEFNKTTQDFVRLVIKFIGPSLYKNFCDFYGDDDTFIFNVVEYFNNRYEEDSIRKQTIEEMSSDAPSEDSQHEQQYKT